MTNTLEDVMQEMAVMYRKAELEEQRECYNQYINTLINEQRGERYSYEVLWSRLKEEGTPKTKNGGKVEWKIR